MTLFIAVLFQRACSSHSAGIESLFRLEIKHVVGQRRFDGVIIVHSAKQFQSYMQLRLGLKADFM